MQRAKYYVQENEDKVRCLLCPHQCLLKNGQTGICKVRTNKGGILISENYGRISAVHPDPIEKKPLYHYFPGKKIFSIGSVGCNLHCNFCQNCDISQTGVSNFPWLKVYSPEEIVNEALLIPGNIGIAYTYNEPVVFFEYMYDIARLAQKKGLRNVMVSNGFISEEPLRELLPLIDAFNIDLKGFTDDFYRKHTHSHLEPVKRTLQIVREAGKHMEVTNLVIPGLNDDEAVFSEMVEWIATELGKHTVLHLSKYFPKYNAKQPVTPENTLFRLMEIAHRHLDYVYLGNINTNTSTYCRNCKALLISRVNYNTRIVGLDNTGNCQGCGVHTVEM